jgi:hypothetical protein
MFGIFVLKMEYNFRCVTRINWRDFVIFLHTFTAFMRVGIFFLYRRDIAARATVTAQIGAGINRICE